MNLRFVHFASGKPSAALWTETFREALAPLGSLEIVQDAARWSAEERAEAARAHDVVFCGWEGASIPAELVARPGRLRYVCNLTGALRSQIPAEFPRSTIPVTNWGNAMAFDVAEGALTLLLGCLKNLRPHIEEKRAGGWSANLLPGGPAERGGSVRNLRLGLYGLGMIGRRFVELLAPLGARIHAYDPFAAQWPDGVRRVGSLRELFAEADAVSIHAAVTPVTTRSVTAELLALLPDGGVVINTARGEIVDEDALLAEVAAGRLRAGLDVVHHPGSGDCWPAEHPARAYPDLILTAHAAGINNWPHRMGDPRAPLHILHEVALDNVRRFRAGEELRFRITPEIYDRLT